MTSLEDRYRARPLTPEFNDMCQAKFASDYRILSKTEADQLSNKDDVYKLQNNKGYIKKRTEGKNAVIRFTKFSQTENPVRYYESLLKLYLPFRMAVQLKPPPFDSFEDFYETGGVALTASNEVEPVLLIVETNRHEFEKSSDVLQDAWQRFQDMGPLEDAWSQVSPESVIAQIESMDEREDNMDDALLPETIPELENDNSEQARSLMSVEWLSDNMRPLLQGCI